MEKQWWQMGALFTQSRPSSHTLCSAAFFQNMFRYFCCSCYFHVTNIKHRKLLRNWQNVTNRNMHWISLSDHRLYIHWFLRRIFLLEYAVKENMLEFFHLQFCWYLDFLMLTLLSIAAVAHCAGFEYIFLNCYWYISRKYISPS